MNIEDLSLSEIWKEIAKKAQAHHDMFAGLEASYMVNITGKEAATYGLIFTKDTTRVVEGTVDNADCTLTMSADAFKKLLQGNLNTTAAFMTGKLKVKGNIGLALKLENSLKKLSF